LDNIISGGAERTSREIENERLVIDNQHSSSGHAKPASLGRTTRVQLGDQVDKV
jgi:hypothetical protein